MTVSRARGRRNRRETTSTTRTLHFDSEWLCLAIWAVKHNISPEAFSDPGWKRIIQCLNPSSEPLNDDDMALVMKAIAEDEETNYTIA